MAPIDEVSGVPATDYDDQSLFLRPARGEILKVGLLGAALGLFIPLLGFLLSQFFLRPLFCSTADTLGLCTDNVSVGYYTASVLLGAVAIVALANWQVFRPLIIAVAAIAALWGLKSYITSIAQMSGLEYYALSVVLYSAVFILFYWLMRVRQFAISLVLTLLVIALVRWALLA